MSEMTVGDSDDIFDALRSAYSSDPGASTRARYDLGTYAPPVCGINARQASIGESAGSDDMGIFMSGNRSFFTHHIIAFESGACVALYYGE